MYIQISFIVHLHGIFHLKHLPKRMEMFSIGPENYSQMTMVKTHFLLEKTENFKMEIKRLYTLAFVTFKTLETLYSCT